MSRETAFQQLSQTGQTQPTPSITEVDGNVEQVPNQVVSEVKELDSTRFNHLAKKEAALQKERELFKKEREDFQKEIETYKPTSEKFRKFEETRSKDPIEALKSLGFTDTEIMNYLTQEDSTTPEQRAAKAAQSEIQKFRDEQVKAAKELQESSNKSLLADLRLDITKHVASDPTKYEYCNHYGAIADDLIYSTIEAVLAEQLTEAKKLGIDPRTIEVITTLEATEMVEEYYEKEDQAMSQLKKRGHKETPVTEIASKPDAPLRAEVSPGMPPKSKTLTSKAVASSGATVPRNETPSEKRERLMEKLRNIGKS
jgi:hypothetical protein